MRNDKENVIATKSLQFAVEIVNFSEKLEGENKFVIARQLLKSGTSIGANVREAQNAESKADFIHKFKIAAKEAEETDYWLLLCKLSESYPYEEQLHQDLMELIKILSKTISTSKQ